MIRILFGIILLLPLVVSSQHNRSSFGVIVSCDTRHINQIVNSLNSDRQLNVTAKSLGNFSETYLLNTQGKDLEVYHQCLNNPSVRAVEYNYMVASRVKPNDAKLNDQYYLTLVNAYEAWDVAQGGKNYAGKDIVIGVIDDGYDILHEDLAENIYLNPDEIAGDNIDNDNNGYKDDLHGWNTRTNTAIHDIKSHGTNILGVLGAKGNNQKGISGLNWNVKLLPVTTGNLVSDVIEGYEYLLSEKKLYNSSGGTKGSNIVVSSYSGGLSKAFAADHPIWCGLYDKLGLEGVLSVGATTNENDNVDEVGDMPSTCASPYLIVVNSTDKTDEKDATTGYGSISVDVSAPGDRILTTDLAAKGLYKTESGTSLSTPIVAGAAALLYSIQCQAFYTLVTDDPSNAALAIKKVILETVDKKSSLTGKTVSEGRINIAESMNKLLSDFCELELAPKGKLKLNTVFWAEDKLIINYVSPDNNVLSLKIFDSAGKEVFTSSFTPPLFGKKEIILTPDVYMSGMIYFASLISGSEISTKGFNVKDPTK